MRAVAVCSALRRAVTASTPNIPVAVLRHRAMAGLMIAIMAVIAAMVAIAAMAELLMAELLTVARLMVVSVLPPVLLRRPAVGTAVVEAAGAAAADAGDTDGGHQCVFFWWKTTKTCNGC